MKCSSCGSILSYNDKICSQCGAPPEQDYENNKDRVITSVLKNIFSGEENYSTPTKQKEVEHSDNPPQQYCMDCGAPMRMEKTVDEWDKNTGKPKYKWMCYCPNDPKGILAIFKKSHRSPMIVHWYRGCWDSYPGYCYD